MIGKNISDLINNMYTYITYIYFVNNNEKIINSFIILYIKFNRKEAIW